MLLNQVTFKFDTKLFPNRGFDDSTQMGWVADQVLEIVPELVAVDGDGFKSVAYSRASALIGQAMREMYIDFQSQIDILKSEMENLKTALNKLQNAQK